MATKGAAPVSSGGRRKPFLFCRHAQVAAHEAKRGRGKLAEELHALVDQAKSRRAAVTRNSPDSKAVPISKPRGELANSYGGK